MNYELLLVSHLLEGELVETGIDVARGTDVTFAMWHDKSYLCNAIFGAVLSSDANIAERNEPSAWHAGAAILVVHSAATVYLLVEVGHKGSRVVGDLHDVGAWMPVIGGVAELYAVAQDVEFDEAANDASRLALFKLFACALPHNLHIDARVAEQHIFVLAQVGSRVLGKERLLADGFYLAYVANDVAVPVAHHDVATEERIDGFVFLVFLFGIGLSLRTRREQPSQEHKKWQYE